LAQRKRETSLSDLPDDLIPETTADVQRIINATNLHFPQPVKGWKIYTVYKPMQPVFFTPIYDVFEDGATLTSRYSKLRLIEPEIMFRVDKPLPPREKKYSHAEVMDSVTAIIGMEVIDSRFHIEDLDDILARSKSLKSNYGTYADNIANGCVIIGDEIENWRDVAFEDVRVTMTEGDKTLVDFIGGHPFDDPMLSALVGINRIRRTAGVKQGDILLTSSSTSFFSVAPGKKITTTYEGLGSVTASFANT
jgi:2-keto-4-pentenoate hydratase